MKILSARRYESSHFNRLVVRVLVNPDDAPWVHPDGTASPRDHTGDTEAKAQDDSLTLCHECINNWEIIEEIWTGGELMAPGPSKPGEIAVPVPKTNDELLVELRDRLARQAEVPVVTDAAALVGLNL